MSTSFLHYPQDCTADEDITNARRYYHDFNGEAVRIQVYWTAPIWQDFKLWSQSWFLIRQADQILKKYTLKLDVKPTAVPAIVHTAVRAKLAGQLANAVGPKMSRAVAALPQSVRSLAGEILDDVIDSTAVTSKGLINFNGSVDVPYEDHAPFPPFEQLRRFIEPPAEANRLIIVFVPINGPADGFTALFGQWLPWIVVDPRTFNSGSGLIHEIGHACRLGHQQEDLSNATNIMYPSCTNQTQFWGWQVDTIYDSYWCSGYKPPTNYYNPIVRKPNYPYLWDETP